VVVGVETTAPSTSGSAAIDSTISDAPSSRARRRLWSLRATT